MLRGRQTIEFDLKDADAIAEVRALAETADGSLKASGRG